MGAGYRAAAAALRLLRREPGAAGQTLSLHAAALRAGKPLKVWVELESGAVSMQADAFF